MSFFLYFKCLIHCCLGLILYVLIHTLGVMNKIIILKTNKMKKCLLLMMSVMISMSTFAQVSGKVVDSKTGEPLVGAAIQLKGTSQGSITNFDGDFELNVESGKSLVVTYLGYVTLDVISQTNLTILLSPDQNILSEVVITSGIIDVAKVRETPIAVSSISAKEISLKVGNQEFPEIMNTTPGVYATKQGGGYGDSRVSLRGFDQTNTSFLINGLSVN